MRRGLAVDLFAHLTSAATGLDAASSLIRSGINNRRTRWLADALLLLPHQGLDPIVSRMTKPLMPEQQLLLRSSYVLISLIDDREQRTHVPGAHDKGLVFFPHANMLRAGLAMVTLVGG